MKKPALITLGTLAAMAAAVFPAMSGAHGGQLATAMKNPLLVKGNARVTIVHVQKGCHSWSLGRSAPATGVRAVLKPGQRLTVTNKDLDTHKLVRLAGPKIGLGKPLMTNDRVTLTFKTPGVYKLHLHQIEMEGMPEVATIGPDHFLAMVIVVR